MIHENAVHVIIKETWSTSLDISGGSRPWPSLLVGDTASREEAELQANKLARTFPFHGFNAEPGYWWGREEEDSDVHRYIVRAATPAARVAPA